jgi:hypothetical protein
MRPYRGPRIDATILGAVSLIALAMGSGTAQATRRFETVPPPAVAVRETGADRFVGVWLSADDTVRLDISADGTYARSIAGRRLPARGRYLVRGASLLLEDESGKRTTVTGVPGGLEAAGYRLSRI